MDISGLEAKTILQTPAIGGVAIGLHRGVAWLLTNPRQMLERPLPVYSIEITVDYPLTSGGSVVKSAMCSMGCAAPLAIPEQKQPGSVRQHRPGRNLHQAG
jgi:hypothetical protein